MGRPYGEAWVSSATVGLANEFRRKRCRYEERLCTRHPESLAVENAEFRRVLYTAKHCQLVVMSLKPRGRDRRGGPHARPVLSRGGGDRRGGPRRRPHANPSGLRGRRPGWDESQHHQYRPRSAEALHALRARRIIGTASSTIPARTRRLTTNTSTARRVWSRATGSLLVARVDEGVEASKLSDEGPNHPDGFQQGIETTKYSRRLKVSRSSARRVDRALAGLNLRGAIQAERGPTRKLDEARAQGLAEFVQDQRHAGRAGRSNWPCPSASARSGELDDMKLTLKSAWCPRARPAQRRSQQREDLRDSPHSTWRGRISR